MKNKSASKKNKTTKRYTKKCVEPPKVYTGLLPQIIDAIGNFINNSKNPWLIIALLIILSGVFIIHELITIENRYTEQSEIIKNNEKENLKPKDLIFKGVPFYLNH